MKKIRLGLIIGIIACSLNSKAQSLIGVVPLPANHRLQNQLDMAAVGNDLFISTEDYVNFTYGNLLKYDGTNFTQITLPTNHRLQNQLSLAVVGNDLYIATEDYVNFTYGNLFKFDGTNFTQITLPTNHRLQNQLDMAAVGNDLYIATEDYVNFTYGNLFKFDGTNFTQITLPTNHKLQNELSMIGVENTLLVATEDYVNFTYGNLFKFDGTNFTQMILPSNHRLQNQLSMAVVGNDPYIGTEDYVNFTYGNLVTIDNATGTDQITECESYTWIDNITYTSNNNIATYNIISGAANGGDSLVTLALTINNVSDLTTITSGITISANNSGATYQWLDCDNNNGIITGETNQSFSATTNGNYAIELTENGCIDTTACVAITSVGILENSFGDMLVVYPNPTNGNFSVDLGFIYENSQISIIDISGKLIDSKTISQSQILNLSLEEPAGVYIISIQAGDKKAIIRLIKE